MSTAVDRVDDFQRRHSLLGFPIAVVYKYFDDQGSSLAATLTYYAFVAIFPLMLIGSSVLGFILQGNVELQDRLLNSALAQFPIVGTQLGRPNGLQGSFSAVAVGGAAALYGVLGLGTAAQLALNRTWAVPRNSQLNPISSRVRALAALVFAGVVLLGTTLTSSLVSNLDAIGLDVGSLLRWVSAGVSILVTGAVLAVMMRHTTSRRPAFTTALPGALFISVGWHGLQYVGGVYVARVVNRASEVNAVFALVLGLVAFIYVASVIAVLGMEVSVVLRRRLYPRALLTPFTDSVRLTDADRRAYEGYAKATRHKGFEHVEVRFDEPPRTSAAESEPEARPDHSR